MNDTSHATRRSFLKSGAIVAAPIAAVAAPAAVLAEDGSKAKLARLEDERAIEALGREFVRTFNTSGPKQAASLIFDGKTPEIARGTARLVLDPVAEPELVRFGEDGASAHCRYACTVEAEQALEGNETIVRMARMQGNTTAKTSTNGTLVADYVKVKEGWAIKSMRIV